jgi:hypothetical protein
MKRMLLICILIMLASTLFASESEDNLRKTLNRSATVEDCFYVVGDVNSSDSFNGLDVIYGVNYLKGGPSPVCDFCQSCDYFFYCGDVNGSCSYNGLDITFGVNFFKGGSGPIPCQDCPPIF